MEGPSADSVEKHEPASDVDTVVVDSLKALDPNRPIREATEFAALRQMMRRVRSELDCMVKYGIIMLCLDWAA